MKEQTMVTVMITYYNQKKYIKDSLGSVISQKTTFDYEIICSDDGSNDGTYEELLEWREKYPDKVTVIRMQRDDEKKFEPINRVSASRYTMWKKAHGKYVSFLDGDDYYTDIHKLQKQVELLERFPKCVACGQPTTMIWEDNIYPNQELSRIGNSVYSMKNRHYWRYYWFHSNTFIFRNVLKEKQEEINDLFFDDNLITCYFIKHGDVIFSPDNTTVYRQITGSSWNKRSELQKAYVNMAVYYESKRITGWKISSFIKNISAWKIIYDNRHMGFELDKENKTISNVIASHKFINDTINFSHMNIFQKGIYYLKYFIIVHLGRPFSLLMRIERLGLKKINEN